LIRLLTENELFHAAAEEVCRIGQLSQQVTGRFSFVLSGGSTPRRLYELLAERPYCSELDWTKVEFFWGDERAVPPDHPSSNFRMARETLLDKLGVPAERIHRIETDGGDQQALDEAARRYEADIDRVLGRVAGVSSRPPHFNLFLLGMGEDGHTASLFPGTEALEETERWVVAHDVPAVSGKRITMTPPLINAAHFIIFLVAGASKADVLAQVLQGARDPRRYPAQLIRPLTGEVTWMIDRAASASLVQHQRKEA
jgi:6-phosphogluconolactonase